MQIIACTEANWASSVLSPIRSAETATALVSPQMGQFARAYLATAKPSYAICFVLVPATTN